MDRIEAMRLFVRLAERGSFSAAAKDLKIKQSTASKWVAELEAQVGAGLVQRTTRALHFTPSGETFLARSREVLASFDAMMGEMGEMSAEPAGRIQLTAPVVFGRRFVMEPVGAFVKRHRKVEVDVVLDDRYVSLVEETFDLAIRVGVPVDTSARGRKLGEGARILVASPAYLEARDTPQTPEQLTQHECIVHGGAASSAIWRFARRSGKRARELPVAVRGRVAVNNSEAAMALACAGHGIALLADWLVADDVARGTLVPLLEHYETPAAPLFALTPPGRYPSPTVRALIDVIAAALAVSLPRDT
jgi:DNA-binding transcriptional LysR family regulator